MEQTTSLAIPSIVPGAILSVFQPSQPTLNGLNLGPAGGVNVQRSRSLGFQLGKRMVPGAVVVGLGALAAVAIR